MNTAQPEVKTNVDDILITNINSNDIEIPIVKVEPVRSEPVVEIKIEEPKKEEFNDVHKLLLKELKQAYDLRSFTDEQLLNAIVQSKGNPDDIFLYLFSD